MNEGIPTPLRRPAATVRKEDKLAIFPKLPQQREIPYRRRPGRMGVRRYKLSDIAVASPVVNGGELRECSGDATKREDVLVG